MPIIKEREENLHSYLDVHTSLVYFYYKVPFFFFFGNYTLILCWEAHFKESSCTNLWPTAEHLIPVGRNTMNGSLGSGGIWTPLCSSVPNTHVLIVQMYGQINALYCRCFSRDSYVHRNALIQSFIRLDWLHSSHFLCRLLHNPGKRFMSLDHFEIAFKFNWTLPHPLPFVYSRCLIQAQKLYNFHLLQYHYWNYSKLCVQHLHRVSNKLLATFILWTLHCDISTHIYPHHTILLSCK